MGDSMSIPVRSLTCQPVGVSYFKTSFAPTAAREGLMKTCPVCKMAADMNIRISFYSYFKELTGVATTTEVVAEGVTLGELFERLAGQYPKLEAMRRSTLMAVGVDYQSRDYVLKDGDEVSLFPPVQGG